MLYLVEAEGAMEKANEIDRGGGPGETFAKINERFRPQAMWGDPTGRHTFMVVELESAAKVAELMFIVTWFTGNKPKFTPLMDPAVYGEAIANARQIMQP